MQDSHIHIGSLYQLFLEETQPFRKVHRMIDLFESIIKSHSVVILSEYVNHNQLSEAAKGMLSVGLRTPSLGTWQLFARVLFEELKVQGYEWSFADFPDEFSALEKALNADKTNVIAFRNSYAHGATPTDAQCKADVFKFEPFLVKLLSSKWLLNTVTEVRDGKVWISSKSKALCAHPLLVHKSEDGAPIAFFNDLKNDKVGLLNYPLSKHYREKEFFKEFHEYLPLNEWKKTGNSDFLQRIEELTETFKGRLAERSQIHDFVLSKSKGYLSIQGNPGIGKSALIAQVFKEIKSSNEAKQIYCIEYFIRRGTQQADVDYLLNYLIKRTDEVFSQGREIRAEGKMTFDLQNQLFSKWRLWAEHSQGKKLLFLIDGLDEGVEKNVLTYMPRENFENILIIYGSRPGGHKSIDELWSTLPPEHHICLQLEGLSIADIRALIYDVANKYELERESVWVDAVQQRSQGNPLYLRLLCNAIENGSIALNDLNALPKEIDEYYKAILSRYAQDMIDGDALLAGLFTFAAAKDYLTMAHLGLINQLGDATVQRIGSTLKEVLYENPITDEVLDYQLFHESFREYLVKEKAKQVNDAAERILDFCASWDTLEGTWEQRYALEHYASHLSESKKEVRAKELWGMLENSKYKETQKKVLKHYDASRDLARIGLLKASELKQFDLQLEYALQLVDIKYEEANDAPQVVALVADGEIDLALKRIESFGGADEDGVKRRFLLYMLCLMELTLMESKAKPHRKVEIAKILQHLDEQIPDNVETLNWSEFFPSKLIFDISCDLAELELDLSVIFKRTGKWDLNWLDAKRTISAIQFELLLFSTKFISDEGDCIDMLLKISAIMWRQGMEEESDLIINNVSDIVQHINKDTDKIRKLLKISREFAEREKLETAKGLLKNSLSIVDCLEDNSKKREIISEILKEMSAQGLFDEAYGIAEDINDLNTMAFILAEQGKFKEALLYAESLNNESDLVYNKVCLELVKQNDAEQAVILAKEKKLYFTLVEIFIELSKQGKSEELSKAMRDSISIIRSMDNQADKKRFLIRISDDVYSHGNIESASSILQEALVIDETDFLGIYSLVPILAKLGFFDQALSIASEALDVPLLRLLSFMQVCEYVHLNGDLMETQSVIYSALEPTSSLHFNWVKLQLLIDICEGLTSQDQIEEAFIVAEYGNSLNKLRKDEIYLHIIKGLARLDRENQSLTMAGDLEKGDIYEIAVGLIATEMAKKGKVHESTTLMEEAIGLACNNESNWGRVYVLQFLFKELVNQGKLEDAINGARSLELEKDRIFTIIEVYHKINTVGKIELDLSMLQDDINSAISMSNPWDKWNALVNFSTILANQNCPIESNELIKQALLCVQSLDNIEDKGSALKGIGVEMAKQGKLEDAEAIGNEICSLYMRLECWKEIGLESLSPNKWKAASGVIEQLKNGETREFFLKGWSEKVNVTEVTGDCIAETLPLIINDSDSIETLLHKYAVRETLLCEPEYSLQQRLNRTLQIQWAIDIAAQFPKKETTTRLSTNLNAWLHEIVDEDDREQIELWAKQVMKGKITEEQFGQRVSEI